ncbi:MAG: hypothetical protein AB1736_01865 [Chloroflexota bacterium]
MTKRSDIERVLDLWLDDGPTHVPDRVFDEAVAAVYRAPQRSPWRLRWRNLTVNTRLLAASIAVLAVVAVVGVGLYALRPTDNTATTPTPTPTVTPEVTSAPTSSACQPSEPGCRGALASGIHFSDQLVTPLRYSVPEGWRKELDVPGALNLVANGTTPETFIAVWPDWQIMSQSDCANRPEEGLGRGVSDLVTFLVDHPGLVASPPEAVVLGGLPGIVLDIRRDEAWTGPCPNAVNLFTHQGTINDIGWQDVSGSRVNRLWLLDGPDGHVTNVAIEAPNDEAFDAFAEIATPVIESIVFTDKSSCVDGSPCIGRLLPGAHRTWSPFSQPFAYVVPDGWKNIFNTAHGYVVQPADETQKGGGRGIYVFLDLQASNQAACTRSSQPGVGRTREDLVAWLTSLPDLSISDPVNVEVGGLSGVTYDLRALGSGPVCGSGDYMLWFADDPNFWWGMTPGNPERHFVLDRPDGGTVFIIVTAPEADFDGFVEAAMPIVESFAFSS